MYIIKQNLEFFSLFLSINICVYKFTRENEWLHLEFDNNDLREVHRISSEIIKYP